MYICTLARNCLSRKGDGPLGLVLVPTRELALQIYQEAKKYSKVYNISVICAYGGGNKYEQSKAFEAGAEIVIATPGRMIDMIKMKATNLERVTYLG
jgi:ATP-dependent RNA helicase DDX42